MELELLDQLLASDEPLRLAWIVFDVENHPDNIERARRAILMQVKEGLLQVLFKEGAQERLLEEWELRQILEEAENWRLPHEDARYFLRITSDGAKLV